MSFSKQLNFSPILPTGYKIHEQSNGTFVVEHPEGYFLTDDCYNVRFFSKKQWAKNAADRDAKHI